MKEYMANSPSDFGTESLANMSRNLSAEEAAIILLNMPAEHLWNGLRKRDESKDNILSEVKKAFKGDI